MRRRAAHAAVVLASLSPLVAPAQSLAAQVEAEAVLRGRVVRGPEPQQPVGGGTAVLHRVAPDTAGEIDSLLVDPDGAFAFRLPSVPGGGDEIYFASVEHDGILYFGQAVTTAAQLDSVYRIEVHDTAMVAPGGARLALAVRYVVLEEVEGEGGGEPRWQATDLLRVVVPGSRTLVSGGGDVWSYPLPGSARSVEVGAGDVGPDAVVFEGGALRVRAPLSPGERTLLVRYEVEGGPGVEFALPGRTGSMELLVREPAPPLEVSGLVPSEPVAMESGSTYRRYAGAELQDAQVTVRETDPEGPLLTGRGLAVLLALLLAGAGIYAWARPRRGAAGPPTDPPDPGRTREALVLEIARIDESLEGEVDDVERRALTERRAALMERLRGAR